MREGKTVVPSPPVGEGLRRGGINMKKHFLIGLITSLLMLVFALTMANKAQAAPPAYQAFSAIAASTGANVTVTLPAHQADDIFLLSVVVRDQDDTITVAGWTQIATVDRGAVSRYWWFWKRAASASETNPLVNKSTGTGDTYAAVITYRGAVTTGDPWEVKGTPQTSTADPVALTGITTLTADSLVVAAVAGEDNNNWRITTTGTNPAAYTEHYRESATGRDGVITFSEAARTVAGATGNVSVNWDWRGNPVGSGGILLALIPPPPAGVSNKLAFLQQPTDTTAGAAISPAVKVEIQDASGTRVNDNTTQVTISIGTNPGGGTLSGTLTVTAAAGVATFSDLSINNAGNGYTLVATAASLPNPTATSNSFNIRGPNQLAFLQQPTDTTAGVAISPAVTVQIQDSLGNLVPIATNTVTIAIGANPSAGTLSGTLSVAAVAGVATFSDLSIDRVGNGYTLTVSSAGLTGATSDPFNITTSGRIRVIKWREVF